MKFKLVLIIVSIIGLVSGCTNDTHQFSSTAEEILPGRWRIESVVLPANPEGITYQGNTFFNDTVLFDIGEFEFGTFDFYDGALDFPVTTPIACNLNLENENFAFVINNLIISHGEMHGSFNQIIPGGIDTIDTPGEEFVWSSRVFANNYSVFTDGTHHVRLEKWDWPISSVIELEKLE